MFSSSTVGVDVIVPQRVFHEVFNSSTVGVFHEVFSSSTVVVFHEVFSSSTVGVFH